MTNGGDHGSPATKSVADEKEELREKAIGETKVSADEPKT